MRTSIPPSLPKLALLAVALATLTTQVGCTDANLTLDFGPTAGQPTTAPSTTVQPQQCVPGQPCPFNAVSWVDIPVEIRKKNYKGGSCFHAALGNCLTTQGHYPDAVEYWGRYAHGANIDDMARNAESMGYRYAYVTNGDVEFLEWCNRTRRWAAITFKSSHAINFCGFEEKPNRHGEMRRWARLLDNNHPKEYEFVEYSEFVRRWRNSYGGDAITVIYDPIPPEPAQFASN